MPRREWLVTNGLGGYASGTVAGVVTRRYHGLLVASLPAPLGRMVMLNHLLERVRLADGRGRVAGRRGRSRRSERGRPGRTPGGVPPRGRAAGVDVRIGRRRSSKSACSCRTDRTPSTSPTVCSKATGRCGCRCVRRFISGRTRSPVNTASAAPTPFTAAGDRYEVSRRTGPARRCGCCCTAAQRADARRESARRRAVSRWRSCAATNRWGRCGAPAISAPISRRASR